MAGLMPRGGLEPIDKPETAAPGQAEPDPDVVSDDEGDEPATVEEQHAYDGFMNDALEIIYGSGEVKPGILKLLDDDPSDLREALGDSPVLQEFGPGVALAATAVIVVLEIVRAGAEEGIPDSVILHGGKAVLEELAEVAEKAGIRDFSEDELNKSFFIALDLYRETAEAEGLLDPSQLKEEFGAIKAADAEGLFGQAQGEVVDVAR